MQQLRSRTWRWVWRVRGPILHSGRKFINSSQNLLRQKSEEIHIATCQIITILCLWALRLRGLCNSATLCQVLKLPSTYGAYGPQGIKLHHSQADWQNPGYYKVYQWQYNEAMRFVLWVAQKNNLQAKWAYSIFKYMKLKSYEKKCLYVISFILP